MIHRLINAFSVLLAATALAGHVASQPVQFAVIGDMPYTDAEYALLEHPDGALAKAIKALDPPVLIHLGDFKPGRLSCSDELLQDRYRQIAFLHPHKTVYTPGDNEWTDCDRLTLSGRHDELERLDFLRQLFFQRDEHLLTQAIPGLLRQQDFIENALWHIGPVIFATLHIPGTNNGRREILNSNAVDALDEADRRDRFNLQWLEQVFAASGSSQAIVLAFHADIFDFNHEKPACTDSNRTECDGYRNIRDAIKIAAAQSDKPILLIHGDTQAYCLNQPYYEIRNLWRLNAPGDYKYSDASRVAFDAANKEQPFTVTGLLGQKPAPSICDNGLLDLSNHLQPRKNNKP